MKGTERHKVPVINSHGAGQERHETPAPDDDHTHGRERGFPAPLSNPCVVLLNEGNPACQRYVNINKLMNT